MHVAATAEVEEELGERESAGGAGMNGPGSAP
jgi:hypothetical protein